MDAGSGKNFFRNIFQTARRLLRGDQHDYNKIGWFVGLLVFLAIHIYFLHISMSFEKKSS